MKTRTNKLWALLLTLALLLPGAVPALAAEASGAEQSLEKTVNWLKQGEKQVYNDSFFERVALGETVWSPLGVQRSAYREDGAKALAAFAGYVTDIYGKEIEPVNPWDVKKPAGQLKSVSDTARISIMALALGGNPASCGVWQGKNVDLLADVTSGKFPLDSDGVTATAYRLIALDAARAEIPQGAVYSRKDLLSSILGKELAGGGFSWGDTLDVDTTAMVLQALAPYTSSTASYGGKTVKQVVGRALAALSGRQQADGSFPTVDYFTGADTPNPDSTAQVLDALCMLGIDPNTDARFVKNGKTAVDGLLSFQSKDGGFFTPYSGGDSDLFATEDALLALASVVRLQNDQRALYDFAAEPDQTRFLLESGGETYSLPLTGGDFSYTLELPAGTKSVTFVNFPIGVNGTASVALNQPVAVEDGQVLAVTLGGKKNAGEYRITVALKKAAPDTGSGQTPGGGTNPPTGAAAPVLPAAVLLLAGGGTALLALRRKKQ